MKYLKYCFTFLFISILFSSIVGFADNNAYIAGSTIQGYTTYSTSSHQKLNPYSYQSIETTTTKDTTWWINREIRGYLFKPNLAESTASKKFNGQTTKTFNDDTNFNAVEYYTANFYHQLLLEYNIYLNATWYID